MNVIYVHMYAYENLHYVHFLRISQVYKTCNPAKQHTTTFMKNPAGFLVLFMSILYYQVQST